MQDVYEVVPDQQPWGKKHATTRWEIVHRADGVREREFKRCEFMDDVFAPSSSPSTGRLVDHYTLKRNFHVFCADGTNMFFHEEGDEECYADPPREWLARDGAEGRLVRVKWQLRCQLYGRRHAGSKCVDFRAFTLEEAGCVRCDAAPQFFVQEELNIVIEVHMDGLHCAGAVSAIEQLKLRL